MPRFVKERIGKHALFFAPVALVAGCVAPSETVDRPPNAYYGTMKLAVDDWFAAHPNVGTEATLNAPALGTLAAASASASQRVEGRDAVVFTGNLDFFEIDPSRSARNGVDDELLRLAQTMGMLRAQLKAAGYPDNVYEGSVSQFETVAQQAVYAGRGNPIDNDNAMESLVARINQIRAATHPALPPIEYASAQYATYVRPVILRSNPEGGRVWVISELRFQVCKRTVSDPYDLNVCPPWKEADAHNPMPLAGTYAYQIHWKNGRAARGQRTIFNDQSDSPIVYVLP